MPGADPDEASVYEVPFDPAEAIALLTGYPRRAQRISRLVRTEVTDTVCRLLPGADNAIAARWLKASIIFLFEACPEWVKHVDRGIAPGRTNMAALPAALMIPMTFELPARYEAAHPEAPMSQYVFTGPAEPPVPSDTLYESREDWDRIAAVMFEHYKMPPELVSRSRTIMTTTVRGAVNEPGNEAWGGWILLAALTAMNMHGKALPEPGRADAWRLPWHRARADEASVAFNLGRAFTVLLAQGLLAPPQTEPGAADQAT
jgi:hypothetical protein